MLDLVGQTIAQHYQIQEQLGQGGMATVYRALDTRLDREVAIKFIRREDVPPAQLAQLLKRFEREAKALARFSHPNIVKIHDFGEYEGTPYLVMEYLPGGTLKQRLGLPLPPAEAARLLLPIAHALAYAHQQDIIHRDIKPANILITQSGDPMLTDFGIAKILHAEMGQTALTGTNTGLGTPDYMAPEQWTNEVVPQSDIYGLGVVFYEMVTGHRPYTADTPAGVLMKQIQEPLPRPSLYVPDLPEQVELILYKALERDPHDRYPSMTAFAEALEGVVPLGAPADLFIPPVAGIPDAAPPFTPGEITPRALGQTSPSLTARFGRSPAWTWLAVGAGVVIFGLGMTALGIAAWAGSHQRGSVPQATLPAAANLHPTAAPATAPAATPLPPALATPTLAPTLPAPETLALPSATPTPTPVTPTTTPIPRQGSTQVAAQDGMVQVYVPAGPFWMGAGDKEGFVDERPQHQVDLEAFWIDRTEVTTAMFSRFVAALGYQTDLEKFGSGYVRSGGWTPVPGLSWRYPLTAGTPARDDHPVMQVSWNDAMAYCQWAGRRLPTEAEWEKAARGTEAGAYPWGSSLPDDTLANFGSHVGDTTAVGSYLAGASPYGALDMAGNAFEWTADWYGQDYYSISPNRNPHGPQIGQYRILRGGSWQLGPSSLTPFNREVSDPATSNSNIGFRCARSADAVGLLVNPANTQLPAATPIVAVTPGLALGASADSAIDGMAQVYVPTGRFQMGSTDADLAPVLQSCPGCSFSAEQPQHTVTLDAYWIDQTDVTNAMFAQFVAATGYKTEAEKAGTGSVFNPDSKQWEDKAGADWRHPGGPEDSNSRLDDYPVVQVTWQDARAYCAWAGRRLPTEAEWEKAARGIDGRRYPWGNTPPAANRLNFADLSLTQLWADQSVNDGFAYASPAGHYPDGVSPYGALDMAGNVWQWTADWFSDTYYAAWPAVNPAGPEQGNARVVRGGSWLNQAINVRAAYRYGSPPSTRSTSTGFRCARTPDAIGLGVLAAPTATPG